MISTPTLKDATLEVDGRVALLTFNRDDVRNALTRTELVSEQALAAFFEKRPGVFKGL